MNRIEMKSNIMLLLTAAIWGFAFVTQRIGAEFVGTFTINGVRFAIGWLTLIPLILYQRKSDSSRKNQEFGRVGKAGFIAGIFLFIGVSLQQFGLAHTTAGKAAFVTGLYIVIVPMIGIFLKQRMKLNSWAGAIVALVGLYLLCVTGEFSISKGDLYELIGAFFWAAHILIIDHYSGKVDPLKLSSFQLAVCSLLSLTAASFTETITIAGILQAAVPILYGGICSVGIAFTLQILGQKHAQPSHAAIILSMETVFATIGGFIVLNEVLTKQGIVGSILMLIGMLLAQLPVFDKKGALSEGSSNTAA